MSMTYKTNAYGKINLYLDVLDKMENGYHNIESVMQSVSLCDIVTLEIDENEGEYTIEIVTSGGIIPNDKTNIVYKCAKKILDRVGSTNKKHVFTIEKRIPVSAGMAGGSSDGAAALRLLNEAYGDILNYGELCEIGASVGADIPFCLTGGTCICKGIGNVITPLPPLKDVLLLSAIDYSSVSTPVAFAMLDEKYGTSCESSQDIDTMIDAVKNGDISRISSSLYNKFESVIIPTNENVEKIKNIMLENGALGTLMSGSGPSVFGIFLDEISQNRALSALKNCSINAFLCKTV